SRNRGRPGPAPDVAPPGSTPPGRVGASAQVPNTSQRAAYYPTVTPRRSLEDGAPQNTGAVYRPGPVPPGQARSAHVPADQRPADHVPPGQRTSGLIPPGHQPAGQAQPGQVPPGQVTPGTMGPGATTPDQVTPGPTRFGPTGPGTTTPDQVTPGPTGSGPTTPGRVPPDQVTAGPTTPGHVPPDQGPRAPLPPDRWQGGVSPAPPYQGSTYQGSPDAPPYHGPPGPYPPIVDPRAMRPHPQVHQPPITGQPPAEPSQQPPPVDPYQQLSWVADGTPTAEEFARRRLAKPAEPTATMGARAMLRKGTMGLVRLAPGKHELEYKQDVEMVRRNFGGLRQVTVVNPKGGAGKTVAVLLLAMTFGQKRGGYVLAWDNNETQGTLGMRAQQDFHARTVRDMMRDLHLFRGAHGRVGDLSQYVRAQGEGMFDVLASDESATAGEMLTASAFAEIREIVSRFYKLIFVDTGNNVRAQNWQAAMDATDQLVVTMSARNDSAETAARMLDHLEQSGRQRLVRQSVSVVSMPPTRKDIDLPAIQRHFAARTRAVLLAPYERLIDSGEPLRYGQLSSQTRDAWLKIAAAVAEGL
ncbi:MAG TPA: chromosome partitioning protein, partial [Actinoplanes sp.]|nr:chromosome partitioning protein [Actinoplanes sp.]